MTITEGHEYVGESGKTYLAVSALGQENVWTAVEKSNPSNIVVLKCPSADDTLTGWPRFQHEMIMHELFKDSECIRRQVDRIPASKDSTSPPILVLEILEGTLWTARSKRSFTKGEVRAVAQSILHGLREVHAKGLVYADLKMQNIMLSGFDPNTPGDGSNLVTKLGDLGIVMSPSMGKVQPVTYRAPEIQLKYQITEAADIWGFALVYCHLLEAQTRFTKTGLYDDLDTGFGTMPEREEAAKVAVSNDYDLFDVEYYQDCPLPCNDPSHEPGRHWEELKKRGLDDDEIEFLKWVLRADPTKRPTASAILRSKWFGGRESNDALRVSMDSKDVRMASSDIPNTSDTRDKTSQAAANPLSPDMVQAMKRKHSDQPQQRSSRGFVASVAPFLPWLASSDSTNNNAAQENVDVSQTPVPQSSEMESTQPQQPEALQQSHAETTVSAPEAEKKSAAPFLPWLHPSNQKAQGLSPSSGVPTGTLDPVSIDTESSLKSHPLVATALSNQDDHHENGSLIPPSSSSAEVDHQASSMNNTAKSSSRPGLRSNGGTYLSYR